nr:MAG TPA: hypothetical protein [Caudoviricetes sp.]
MDTIILAISSLSMVLSFLFVSRLDGAPILCTK